jgi:glycine/D-amino acid oxidase-like deaminating enzyme
VASGIGAAVGRRLAEDGARVAVVDRDGAAARGLASLEQSNFTSAELIQVATDIAAHPPPDGRAGATLALTPEDLVTKHFDRRSRIHHDKFGLADTLLILAEQPDHGCVRIDKPELAERLAELLITELRQATSTAEVETLKQRRPVTRFVIERLCPVLNRPQPKV